VGKILDKLRAAHAANRPEQVLAYNEIGELLNEINEGFVQARLDENLTVSDFLQSRAQDDIKRGNTKSAAYVQALRKVIDTVRARREDAFKLKAKRDNG
jgi:hypothetical protein